MVQALFLELFSRPGAILQLVIYSVGLIISIKRRTAAPAQSKIANFVFSLCILSWANGFTYRAWMFHAQISSTPVITHIAPKTSLHAPQPGLFEHIKQVGTYVGYFDQLLWLAIWSLIIYALFFIKPMASNSPANA